MRLVESNDNKQAITILNDWLVQVVEHQFAVAVSQLSTNDSYIWSDQYASHLAASKPLVENLDLPNIKKCISLYEDKYAMMSFQLTREFIDGVISEVDQFTNWESMILESMEISPNSPIMEATTTDDTDLVLAVSDGRDSAYRLSGNGGAIWDSSEDDRFKLEDWMDSHEDYEGLLDALITYQVITPAQKSKVQISHQ